MDIGLIEAFISVAESQSFSKAAEKLHLTQSAVSKRISLLEKNLDTVLFERFGIGVTLTENGKRLLINAREIIDTVKDMKNHISISKNIINGKLRIVTSHYIGLYRLPSIIKSFTKKYNKVELDIHFTDSEIAYEEIKHGLFDLAIATLPKGIKDKTVKTLKIWQDELVVIFAKNHPINNTMQTNSLSSYPTILPDESTFTRKIIDNIFKENKINYKLAFTTNYLETIKVMVETGLGWSVLPKVMLNGSLNSFDLPKNPTRMLGIMIHKNKVITPTLNAFLKELNNNVE